MADNSIDPIAAASALDGMEIPNVDLEEGGPDAIRQIFENARLDSAIGTSGFALKLQAETAGIERRATDILKRERKSPPASESVPDDSASWRLEKREREEATTIVKSPNGKFWHHLDENGNLIRAIMIEEDAA
jgi:hypothetical protein